MKYHPQCYWAGPPGLVRKFLRAQGAEQLESTPSPLVVSVNVSARWPARVEHARWFVVQLLPSADIADKWKDPRTELRVVRERGNGLLLFTLGLLRNGEQVKPNPDFTVAGNVKVGLDVFQPSQLGPFIIVRVIRPLPIVRHEVGECAIGYLRMKRESKVKNQRRA